jgi:hypothetical protein
MKQIGYDEFVKEFGRKKLMEVEAIAQFWCPKLNSRDQCTTICRTCKPFVDKIFRRFEEAMRSGDIINPNGLLVWITRDEEGKFADDQQIGAILPKGRFGEDIEIINPFAELLKEFS